MFLWDDIPVWVLHVTGDRLNPDAFAAFLGDVQAGRPVLKGKPVGRSTRPTSAVAVTSIYPIWSGDHFLSSSRDEHLAFLLDTIEPHMERIKAIMTRDGLSWNATLLDIQPHAALPSLDPRLLARARALQLPLRAEREP